MGKVFTPKQIGWDSTQIDYNQVKFGIYVITCKKQYDKNKKLIINLI